jgi:HNH endonuclease
MTPCVEYRVGLTAAGYARVTVGGVRKYAHRHAFEQHYGVKLTPEQKVCHTCDNPCCVNPDHLFVGTDADNARDKSLKGRCPHGEKHPNAVLTAEVVVEARRLKRCGLSYRDVARRLGFSLSTLRFAIEKVTWKHIQGAAP